MKKYLIPSIRMTLVMLVLCCGVYFGLITLIGKAAPGSGDGVTVEKNGKVVGYANVGQKFTEDNYFWSRPSAVDYHADGSAGSNKATSNPDYLKTVQERIDTFMAHNPGVAKSDIPAEMVTASGSGLDPHISPQSALIQVARVAKVRGVDQGKVKSLVEQHVEKGTLGPDVVNVLKLNVALDEMK
jgi:potassium-transporting ATPase KdpC subunit